MYEGEELNHRSFYLRVLRRLWLVPGGAAVTAILFGVIYTIYVTAFTGQRQYLETSKYYVHFAFNENTQAAYDAYNAYTWDDILYAHPAIRDAIAAGLPEGMTMEEAREDTEAIVLSDIRLLTIEVTAATPEKASALADAIAAGLARFGEVMEEFESIEFLSHDEPQLVVIKDRTNNAVILGAVLGALTALLWLLIRESSSDALYTVNDLAARFPEVPVLGFTIRHRDGNVFAEDLLLYNLAALGEGPFAVIADAAGGMSALPDAYLRCDIKEIPDDVQGVLLAVPYGIRGSASRTETLLHQLQYDHRRICGVILTDCNAAFLRSYYGMKI